VIGLAADSGGRRRRVDPVTADPSARWSGVEMRAPDGARWTFDPGALCLDFLLTTGSARAETLQRPADLAHWLVRSRLHLPAGRVVPVSADVAEARRLRGTLARLVHAWVLGHDGDPVDVDVLNQIAAGRCLAPRIEADGGAGWVLPAAASQALATIARDAVTLRTGPLAGRLRECAAVECPLVFVDTTGPGLRRWCRLERCGNRAAPVTRPAHPR
jgi:predicted RNA-binding Zn ribbon-like protein